MTSPYRRSKSSSSSLYFLIWRTILESSDHLIKSSRVRVTRNAGSVTTSGPMRMCPAQSNHTCQEFFFPRPSSTRREITKQCSPCSTNWTACRRFSANFRRISTTGSLLRAKAEAVIFSHSTRLLFVGMRPISYSLSSICSVVYKARKMK